MKSIFRHCLVVLAFAFAQTTFAQVQIDRDLEMNGGPGDRDITGATTVDVSVGYSFGGTATAQRYLRGNGSYFVPSPLLAADLSGTISNAQLANASVTINTGTGLSGGGSLALGGSLSLTNTGVTSLSGTANQISVSSSTGAVTLSTPQNIHTGASPTFTGLTLSGLAASSAVYTNGSKNLTTTAPTSGALGYWTRTGTNLYPTTLTDNTGIGTSAPAVKLEVAHNGASTFGTAILINQNAVGNSDGPRLGFRKLVTAPSTVKDWTIGIQNGVGADRFGISENGGTGGFGTERFTILAGGNVGIGTSTPGATLDIAGSATSGIRTQYLSISTNNTGVSDRPFIRGTNTHLVINGGGTASGGDIYLNYTGDGATGAVRIRENLFAATNGNVGIGVVSPSYKLQAQGDIYANGGWFRVSGNQGYYFETHGGGWQMTDATWIRAYNSKRILATGGLAGNGNNGFGTPFGGSPRIYANFDNAGSGGIAISDDGGFYDYNDGYIEYRGSTGLALRVDNGATGILMRMTNTGGAGLSDRRIITDSNGWGLIGAPGNAWYEMWSYNFLNASDRLLKKDITKVESGIGETIMRDLDKMHPYLYRYNVEMDEMVEGLETKYRPNYHLGLILDETPDYIQAASFDGVDVYAVASLGIAAAKHNRAEIKEIKEAMGMNGGTRTVQDFGSKTITGRELTVKFDEAFTASLNGAIPVVTISTNTPDADLVVKEKSANGFKIVVNGSASNVSFDYIAMAKVQTGSVDKEIAPEVADRMYVSESVKNQVREYWKKQPEVMKQYHEQKAKEAITVQQERAKELESANAPRAEDGMPKGDH